MIGGRHMIQVGLEPGESFVFETETGERAVDRKGTFQRINVRDWYEQRLIPLYSVMSIGDRLIEIQGATSDQGIYLGDGPKALRDNDPNTMVGVIQNYKGAGEVDVLMPILVYQPSVVSRYEVDWVDGCKPEGFKLRTSSGGVWSDGHNNRALSNAARLIIQNFGEKNFAAISGMRLYTSGAHQGEEKVAGIGSVVDVTDGPNGNGIEVTNLLNKSIQFRFLRGS